MQVICCHDGLMHDFSRTRRLCRYSGVNVFGFKVDSHLQNVWWVAMGWEKAHALLILTALSLVLMVTFKWNIFQNEQLILILFIKFRYYWYLAGYTCFLSQEWYSSRCISKNAMLCPWTCVALDSHLWNMRSHVMFVDCCIIIISWRFTRSGWKTTHNIMVHANLTCQNRLAPSRE